MIDSHWQDRAVEAINEIISHPGASLFKSPVETGTDTDRDYYSEISNPQDFGTIKERLQKKEYQSIKQLTNDVDLIYKNAEKFNGHDSDVAVLAKYCVNLFHKILKKRHVMPLSQWCNEVYRLRCRVNEQMIAPPPKVRQFSSSHSSSRSSRHNTPMISEKELNNFIQASEKLQSEEDHKAMVRILNENQPELDVGQAEINLDLTRLTDQTITALIFYMREALAKKGLSYPE